MTNQTILVINPDIKHTTSNSLQNMDNKGIFGPILEVSHRTPSCVRLLQQHIFKERFPSSCQDFNKERAAPRESLAFSRALEHFLLSHRHRMLSGITPPLDLSNSQVSSETAEQWLPQNLVQKSLPHSHYFPSLAFFGFPFQSSVTFTSPSWRDWCCPPLWDSAGSCSSA